LDRSGSRCIIVLEEDDMRIRRIVSALILIPVFAVSRASGQSPAPLLVDVDWLAQHLADRDLVVLHVGDAADYAEHLPGARLITEDDVSRPHDHSNLKDMMLELPDAATLRAKVAGFGISDTSRIVVYAGRNTAVQSATRIVFTLDYLGLGARTSLLNGGYAAWTRAGKPVTSAVPPPARGTLTAAIHEGLVADAAFVASVPARPGHKLVDARAPVFYKGIEPTMNGKAGHIPGAVNIPFTEMIDTNLMIDRTRIAGAFARAGVEPGETVVAYCHVGQQATAVIFAARLLGHPVVLYDGAFQDWAVNHRGTVEK
jgi:thiosulfate/3-mercaptopyruvate sulfurtransferase